MPHPSAESLYVTPDTIEFLYVSQFPNDRDRYLDVDFAGGEPCAQAVLTYDFEAKVWTSIIVTSEDPDGEFNEEHETTPEQHSALLGQLPERLETFRAAAEKLYDEAGSFEEVKELVHLLEQPQGRSPH